MGRIHKVTMYSCLLFKHKHMSKLRTYRMPGVVVAEGAVDVPHDEGVAASAPNFPTF
jgi:hypothetical protein